MANPFDFVDLMARSFELSLLEIIVYAALLVSAVLLLAIVPGCCLQLWYSRPTRDPEMVRYLRDRERKAVNS